MAKADWLKPRDKLRDYFQKQRRITQEINRKNKANAERVRRAILGEKLRASATRAKSIAERNAANAERARKEREFIGETNTSEIVQEASD